MKDTSHTQFSTAWQNCKRDSTGEEEESRDLKPRIYVVEARYPFGASATLIKPLSDGPLPPRLESSTGERC